MSSPVVIGWLQRALRHEFAAARQFALQAVIVRRLGQGALAGDWERAASDELSHAQRFGAALAELGASFNEGATPLLPIGRSVAEVIGHATDTEQDAVRLYRAAARACIAVPAARALFEAIGAEEADHLEGLKRLAAA